MRGEGLSNWSRERDILKAAAPLPVMQEASRKNIGTEYKWLNIILTHKIPRIYTDKITTEPSKKEASERLRRWWRPTEVILMWKVVETSELYRGIKNNYGRE